MNTTQESPLTRRETLIGTFNAAVVITSLTLPAMADASPVPCPAPEPEFVPENDYPFFGGELPDGY
ncbi:MAG: hypothetical protein JNK37_18860 [Verrucomicrobiales bacterium]|nr:hypothetical protein [Verrucomicrobiales bacterium]